MHSNDQQHRTLLQSIAHRAMIERGLLPDFSAAALAELDKIQAAAGATNAESIRDLTDLLWASIDNDDSRDLDQLTVAETLPGGNVKIRVAVADVDALVKDGSAIDEHARTTRPRFIRRPRFSRCCLRRFLPTSPP
ncbi:RNB domain-containing ribonuclease [Candidatus Amarolinea dominans]|uniref:RNB domain-containing ribonuclease n=1 Tax=Candidatus Amarolinea dominans TaxID=3140696 RepID=UPI0031CCB24C